MNTKTITFRWQHPAAISVACPVADIAGFRAVNYVQEAACTIFNLKVGYPKIDLPSLMAIADLGAIFCGNIDRTSESGPAVFAGCGHELVIVPSNDALRP